MKYSAVIVAALAAAASAQDISIFPSCSLPCIMDAISKATNCQTTDFVCVCKNMDALTSAATGCVVDKCGIDVATGQVLPATKQFCAEVASGGSSSSGSASAPGTTTTTQSATESSMTIQTSTVESSSAPSEASTTSLTTSTMAATTTTTKASNGTARASKTATSTPASVPTAGAATLGSFGAAALLMIAAFAL